jgi:hypothetical protein
MKTILSAISFLFLSLYSFSQDSTSAHNCSIQVNFSTVPTQFVSATDTSYSNSLSVAPVLELRSKAGWGVTYSPAFVTSGTKTGLYMHAFSAGLERYGKGKMDLAFTYNHFIFTNKTSVPYTPISNELFFYSSFTGGWIHPVLSASFGFGKDSTASLNTTATELELVAGFNHSFDWDDVGPFSSLEITPGLLLNAGNNQYFSFLSASKYIAHSRHLLKQIKKNGKGKKAGSALSQFAVSNLELSTEMSLEAGRFSLHPEGSIFVPVSSGDHSFYGYWQIGLQYSF